jgi:hypothetical protein
MPVDVNRSYEIARTCRTLMRAHMLSISEAAVLLSLTEERVLELVARMRAVPVRR